MAHREYQVKCLLFAIRYSSYRQHVDDLSLLVEDFALFTFVLTTDIILFLILSYFV